MRKILLVGVVTLAAISGAKATMSNDEIAKLPPDAVKAARAHCASQWPQNFDMRLFCEDQQFKALQILQQRNRTLQQIRPEPL